MKEKYIKMFVAALACFVASTAALLPSTYAAGLSADGARFSLKVVPYRNSNLRPTYIGFRLLEVDPYHSLYNTKKTGDVSIAVIQGFRSPRLRVKIEILYRGSAICTISLYGKSKGTVSYPLHLKSADKSVFHSGWGATRYAANTYYRCSKIGQSQYSYGKFLKNSAGIITFEVRRSSER